MLKTKALTLASVVALVFALTSCAVFLSDDDGKCIAEINETMSAEGWKTNGDVNSDPEDQPRLEFSLILGNAVIYAYIESTGSTNKVIADITIIFN